jgi:CRISPR-associated protein Csx17
MDAQRLNCKSNPVFGMIPLLSEDISGFIEGFVDEKLIEDLLFGLTWIRWDDRLAVQDANNKLCDRWSIPVNQMLVLRSWAILKLLFLPGPLRSSENEDAKVRPESSIIPLLLAGRISNACAVAQRRLYASGLSPCMSQFPDSDEGARIAAALLLPVQSQQQIADLVLSKK